MESDSSDLVKQLTGELQNFEDIARFLIAQSGDFPRLRGIDIYGGTVPVSGVMGGDHLIVIDFKERFDLDVRIAQNTDAGNPEVVENLKHCRKTAGIALLDATGHQVTDALMTSMLHQAFLLGAIYELDMFGHVTKRLFENLNTLFHRSSTEHKFISLIYGEISEDARFRFLAAAQPFPVVFSNRHDKFMPVNPRLCISFPPVGMFPSLDVTDRQHIHSVLGFKEHYEINEWVLMGQGDILLLHSDGLADHQRTEDAYCPVHLEQKVREVKRLSAAGIYAAIMEDVLAFSEPADDLSLVVVKRL